MPEFDPDATDSFKLGADDTIAHSLPPLLQVQARHPHLVFFSGTRIGERTRLWPGPTRVGRAEDCEIRVPESGVSRRHAVIDVEKDGTVWIVDSGSTNGTYVNGKKATHPIRLEEGDKIALSSAALLGFTLQDELDSDFHEKLYQSAVVDQLTGAYNKNYLLDRLRQEISHSRRTRAPVALIICDIDHFKSVNDTHGHHVGDQVLGELGARLRRALRDGDVLARFGGEEFVVLARGTTTVEAAQLANRLHHVARRGLYQTDAGPLRVTISVGATATDQPGLQEGQALFRRADDLLYAAKNAGRDQVASEPSASLPTVG